MKLVFFAHPEFLRIRSISRYVQMISDGMKKRGHEVEIWAPKSRFGSIKVPRIMGKWMGYIDQYVVFPIEVLSKLKKVSEYTLFVFADNAQGPWVPLVAKRSHVIHCHDFLAQRSAIGEIHENRTSWTGCKYQAFIRYGYSKGKNFISISKKTQEDLHRFLSSVPVCSEIVYNGFNQPFAFIKTSEARKKLGNKIGLNLDTGYLLHVGGNQWYKNRRGVIEIFNVWRLKSVLKLPLLLIGEVPDDTISKVQESSAFKEDIYFLSNVEDDILCLAYAGASLFLFPSLAEGFGWPIAEALASGCPVITTDEAPMTEVAGNTGFYISRRPYDENKVYIWANEAAEIVDKVIKMTNEERKHVVELGLINARKFNTDLSITQIETIYLNILTQSYEVAALSP